MAEGDKSVRVAVRNPRTGGIDDHFYAATQADVARLSEDARRAQRAWLELGVEGRIDALLGLADAFERHSDALVAALSRDTGRRAESIAEVRGVIELLHDWSHRAPELLATPAASATSLPGVRVSLMHTPYALVGAITPWNFPLLLSFLDIIPALLVGCAVLVKPSEVTPRFVEPVERVLNEVPALSGVLAFVRGDGRIGAALIEHVDAVCFTGSVATGRSVAVAAARRLIPAHLELGGKDPAVVFADADIERAAAALCWGATANAGQSCLSIERVYVQDTVFDAFVARLVEHTRALQLNVSDIGQGQIGPIIAKAQIDVLQRHLNDAVDNGARVLCGGALEQHGGTWCQPTVLVDVNHKMQVMRDESFGPLMPVMPFSSEDESVALANDTRYGLSAAVFGADEARLYRVASRLQAGAVSVNDVGLTSLLNDGAKQPFKDSGLGGSRMGAGALARFYRHGSVLHNVEASWHPWWYDAGR